MMSVLEQEFIIRDAEPDDAEALGRLAALLVRMHHDLDPQRFFALREPIESGYGRFLVSEIGAPKAVLLVAEMTATSSQTATVVGYCWGRLEARNWAELLDTHGKLHDVVVDPSARGKGIARDLVRGTIARLVALGAPRVVLTTAAKNEKAQRLFASMGFRPTMIEMTIEAPV